ncbi:MAG: hypothetical protein IIU14_04965, partial [Ruminococcus sp.]|nr:hypothetical protein [Ruminococcus sp.]
ETAFFSNLGFTFSGKASSTLRPKNAPPERFLYGLSSPLQRATEKGTRLGALRCKYILLGNCLLLEPWVHVFGKGFINATA